MKYRGSLFPASVENCSARRVYRDLLDGAKTQLSGTGPPAFVVVAARGFRDRIGQLGDARRCTAGAEPARRAPESVCLYVEAWTQRIDRRKQPARPSCLLRKTSPGANVWRMSPILMAIC